MNAQRLTQRHTHAKNTLHTAGPTGGVLWPASALAAEGTVAANEIGLVERLRWTGNRRSGPLGCFLPQGLASKEMVFVLKHTRTHIHTHTHSLTHSHIHTHTHTHIGILIKWSEQGSSPYKFVAIICLIQSVKHIISVSQLLTLKIIFGLQLLNSKVLTMAPLKLVSKQSWQQDIISISNKFLCY